MMQGCWARCPADYSMTDSSPTLPAQQRSHGSEMFSRLSSFQQSVVRTAPVTPTLPAVLAAALPALEAGFSYSARHRGGELTVVLHYQDAELGSSAPAPLNSYCETTARLLAGLLGIPLRELDDSSEPAPTPSPLPLQQQAPILEVVPDLPAPVPAAAEAAATVPPAAAAEDELEEEEDEEFDDGLGSPDPTTPLDDAQKATAVQMVKVLPVEQRKAFTKAFRELFQVPADAKQIVPFITELRHLQFIDRYTVEAAGGVAV